MARGFGHEYHDVLKHTIEQNEAKGILIKDLKILTDYCITKKELDIRYAPSMFISLTEMYLISHDIPHLLSRNREGAYVSGVTFRKIERRELIETLALGLGRSSATAIEADRLYKIIFAGV